MSIEEQTVIVICIGYKWGIKERRALRDCHLLKSAGFSPYLYCTKESFLSQKAEKENINLIFHRGSQKDGIWAKRGLYSVFDLFLDKHSIHFVHCYSSQLLPIISKYLARKKFCIPLVYSFLETKDPFETLSFYQRSLFLNLDQIFIPFHFLMDHFDNEKMFSSRRVDFIGLGVPEKVQAKQDLLESFKENSIIGIHIPPFSHNLDVLIPFFLATKGIIENKLLKKRPLLVLISEVKWEKVPLFEDLIHWIQLQKMEEDMVLEYKNDIFNAVVGVDLWIEVQFGSELLSDYSLYGLLHQVPVLLPKDLFYFEQTSKSGSEKLEVYKIGDVRDIRAKLLKLFTLKQNQIDPFASIWKNHSEKYYQKMFLEMYSRLIKRRKRLLAKKKKKYIFF